MKPLSLKGLEVSHLSIGVPSVKGPTGYFLFPLSFLFPLGVLFPLNFLFL